MPISRSGEDMLKIGELMHKEVELDQRLASSKEYRELHKQLRKYGYKVPFHKRYQELPTIISVIALIAAYAKEISHFFRYMASFFK